MCFLLHLVENKEIIIKQEGKFLDLTNVPFELKLRSGLKNYLYIRDCYELIIADVVSSLPLKGSMNFAILGTAGIGKSSLFIFILKSLLEDPAKFGLPSRSFYLQTRSEKTWLYRHEESENNFSCHFIQPGERLDASIILFADMETIDGSPTEHAGICLIFTSFRPSRFKELTKNGWQKIMPTWSADEQADYFNSPEFASQYGKEVAHIAYNNISYFGGAIRSNIQVAIEKLNPVMKITCAITVKGEQVCQRFFKAGFGGVEDAISDVLIHRNPMRNEDNSYNFSADSCAYSFASPYVLRCLLAHQNNMLMTEARNKYHAGTFRGGDDGNEFELLCLHGFKISDVTFHALPLTDNAEPTDVTFPPKQILALNWREQENYLKENVLYLPPYGNLESGDAFCLIEINGRWTLVILQCTIAENHPVKQNGVKIIHDCYVKNQELKVDDTVIIFMIPPNGKLKAKQPLVTSKKGVLEEVNRVTIAVTAQYKIENDLVI